MTVPDMLNLLMIPGPESPCFLFTMSFGTELEGDRNRDCIAHLRENNFGAQAGYPGLVMEPAANELASAK